MKVGNHYGLKIFSVHTTMIATTLSHKNSKSGKSKTITKFHSYKQLAAFTKP